MAKGSASRADEDLVRRVQVTGGSTFTVSLPKAWARRNHLARGSAIAISDRADGSLTLRPPGARRKSLEAATVLADRLTGEALLRRLIGAYLSGRDSIEVRANGRFTPAQRESIRRFTRICAGPEIMEETADRVLLTDLVDPAEVTPQNVAMRIHGIGRAMIKDALESLERADPALAQDVRSRDDEVDRLYRLIAKRYAKRLSVGTLGPNEPSLFDGLRLLMCARLLERCADHADRIAGHVVNLKGQSLGRPAREAVARFGQEALSLLDRAFAAFRQSSSMEAESVVSAAKHESHGKDELLAELVRKEPHSAAPLSLLLESLERIRQYAGDVAELALNG